MGAIMKPIFDEDFPNFNLVKDLGLIYATENTKERKRYGIFECTKCSNEVRMPVASAKKAKMCNSCKAKVSAITHGDSREGSEYYRLYTIWKGMNARCKDLNNPQAADYVLKGIKVSLVWSKYQTFKEWALNNGYTKDLTIDRIDNDKGYSPENCRWATYFVQAQNKRKLISTNTSGYRGVKANHNRWEVGIRVNNVKIYLGLFTDKVEAAKAYDSYIEEHNLEHTKNFQ